MKKMILAGIALLVLAQLAACDEPIAAGNNSSTVIVPDDECPRLDGEPCK